MKMFWYITPCRFEIIVNIKNNGALKHILLAQQNRITHVEYQM